MNILTIDKQIAQLEELKLDLAELEAEKPISWVDIAIDTPVLVRDTIEQPPLHRYFAGIQLNGVLQVWAGGATSWSSPKETIELYTQGCLARHWAD